MSFQVPPTENRLLNIIRLSGGGEIRVSDIRTVEEGRAVLDDISGSILAIERQIEKLNLFDQEDRARLQRASRALKVKRRQFPLVEYRLGEIRRAERATKAAEFKVPAPCIGDKHSLAEQRRIAFINATHATLGDDACKELWDRARADYPDAWASEGGGL